jgi:hypothetical protein
VPRRLTRASIGGRPPWPPSVNGAAISRHLRAPATGLERRRQGGTAARRQGGTLALAPSDARFVSRPSGSPEQAAPQFNPTLTLTLYLVRRGGAAREMERRPHALLHALDW